ncbi:ferredoxin [Gelidibacter salicanalis]|uniref:Ferredoxin n=1 Tax=Gelidibacter salicanalis TaxID=291193 RepID=A0A934KMH7_9FLAO|nr:ferredoxin [Serratia sp. PAMC26656]MBJ7880459.1 ferredoxin [Gelidibacter salicanalis]MBJ7894322.1 ferredoxin [Serratia sp. PAMC26656]
MFQIIFHRGKCIGCNGCVEAAPDRWRISRKDGRCNLIEGKEKKGIYRALISIEEYAQNFQAANNCPVRIIQIARI